MPACRILLLLTLLSMNFSALSQVYKSTDADGNTVFSDRPATPDSEEVQIPKPNVGDAVKLPVVEAAPETEPEPQPELIVEEAPSNLDGELIGEDRKKKNRRPKPTLY